MIFDRYRSKSKTRPDEEKTSSSTKKSSLANTLFRKFPIHLSSSKKKLYKKQQLQQQQTIIDHPRISLSLPNILIDTTTTTTTTINNNKPKTPPLIKQRKRHSAEQRRTPRRTYHLKEDVTRHSYTFGHLTIPTNKKTLTPDELTFSSEQLEKLTRLVNLPDNTEQLLSQLGTQPTHPVPHRSMSHQQLTLNTPVSNNNILLFRQNLNRAHSESHAKNIKIQQQQDSIEPEELVEILELKEQNVILIDVRNLIEYQKNRIRGSINVNLPSLLIKRYQRGTVSNFNLENFITTIEGRELYQLATMATTNKKSTTTTTTTILEQKAAEAELKKKQKSKIWVVYDDEMLQHDQTSQAWTLLSVLNRVGGGKMYYLNGGFDAFNQKFNDWTESSSPNSTSLPSPSLSTSTTATTTTTTSSNLNIPRRSISYTIGDSKNDLSKRTSLFSLDTQAARVNNANALARRATRRSQQNMNDSKSVLPPPSSNLLNSSSSSASSVLFPPSFSNQLIRVAEDEDELSGGMLTADTSPRTESDFGFIISEIIPGFLYVGPEIENNDHANQLNDRSIRRVLNMAEECQDEGLDKESFIYHKISARDTLEMKNIELVMMEGVHFIEESKKNHEPIYVHCKAGKSRSITAILAYLVTSERWTLKRAYRHVIKARPNMSPNIGFVSELMKMEGRVHGRVSSFLETDWQSTSLPSPEYANELVQLEYAWKQQS